LEIYWLAISPILTYSFKKEAIRRFRSWFRVSLRENRYKSLIGLAYIAHCHRITLGRGKTGQVLFGKYIIYPTPSF
jgi:hypothetical protein